MEQKVLTNIGVDHFRTNRPERDKQKENNFSYTSTTEKKKKFKNILFDWLVLIKKVYKNKSSPFIQTVCVNSFWKRCLCLFTSVFSAVCPKNRGGEIQTVQNVQKLIQHPWTGCNIVLLQKSTKIASQQKHLEFGLSEKEEKSASVYQRTKRKKRVTPRNKVN